MIYLLRSNASNALAIGGKKGASAAGGSGGVANHLVAVTRARAPAGSRRRAISNIFDHYGGGSRSSDGISNSSHSSSTTLHQTSYNHNHHHHSERQGQHNRTPLIHKGGYICFRLARKSDVPQIQNCNLGKYIYIL